MRPRRPIGATRQGSSIALLLALSCGRAPALSPPDGSVELDASLLSDASVPSDASLAPDSVPPDAAAEASIRDAGADGAALAPFVAVFTQHNDAARSGANLSETVLTPGSLDGGLREIAQAAISDQIFAQPLLLPGALTDAGVRDLLIVASADNRVMALDARNVAAPPIWQIGSEHELGIPDVTSRNVSGNNGILSTPVFDPLTWTLYLVARSCSDDGGVSNCAETLYALDARSGAVARSVAIAGAVPATDDAGTDAGTPFDASAQWNRTALLLVQGRIFIAFAPGPAGDEHEEDFVYHG